MLRLGQTSARGPFGFAIRTYSAIFRHGSHQLPSNHNTKWGNGRDQELFLNGTVTHSPNKNRTSSSSNRNNSITSTPGLLDVTMPNFRGRRTIFSPSCFKRNMSTSTAAGGVGGASGSAASTAIQDAASSTASSVPDPTALANAATAASGAADQV